MELITVDLPGDECLKRLVAANQDALAAQRMAIAAHKEAVSALQDYVGLLLALDPDPEPAEPVSG
jgi:hypothetical protein